MAGTAVAASLGVSLTADSANFESGVDRAARAVRQARSTIDREAQAIARSMQDNASKGAGAFAEQLKSSGKGAAAFAEQLKNSSYQIADFATQIASGQNALVAFTQQGVQFVSSFGTVGAVIGAVGAVVGAVAISLTKADDEAAKTARETANLASVFDELKASTRAAQDEISKITQSYADATDATRLFERQSTEAKIAAAQSAVDAARSKATETIAPFVDPLLERRQRAQLEGPGLISAEQAADAEKIIAAFERFKQGGSIASLDKDFVALQQTLGDRDIAEGAGFIVQQLIAMGQEGEKAEKNLADLRARRIA